MMFFPLAFPHVPLNCHMNENMLKSSKNLFCDLNGLTSRELNFSLLRSQHSTYQVEQGKNQNGSQSDPRRVFPFGKPSCPLSRSDHSANFNTGTCAVK